MYVYLIIYTNIPELQTHPDSFGTLEKPNMSMQSQSNQIQMQSKHPSFNPDPYQ